MSRTILTNFLGGEVSDRVAGRLDAPGYNNTCRTLENYIIHPSGGLDFRPGTYYCGEAKTHTGVVRLIDFARSKTEAYVLELSDHLIRIWKDGALVQSGGSNLEIVTPWAEADLFALKHVQTDEAIYFVHPNYHPVKLSCGGESIWNKNDTSFPPLLAVAHAASPYITIYNYSQGVFEKKTDPAVLPTGRGNECALSPDGVYLAVAHAASPYITIYKYADDVFEKLTNPAALPTGEAWGCAFSPDGVYLAVAHTASPYITIYKRSGDTFTKLADPGELPTGTAFGCTFSVDGVYFAVVNNISPYITIYKRDGDTFTKLADPAILPGGSSNGCAFSLDGVYLTVACAGPVPIIIYKRSGDTFTKLADPATLPTGGAWDCTFSRNGIYLVVGHATSPFITIYKRNGDIFKKLANPATLPTGVGKSCAFSLSDVYLAVAHEVSPRITIYALSGDTFTKIADPATIPTGTAYGCVFSVDGWLNIPWGITYPAALTFHEQRLTLARGRKVWGSRVGFPQDFTQDAADGSYGYEYKFASDQLEDILWMLTKNHNIILGSTSGEWLMTGGDAPLTMTNVYVDRVSAHGSANVAALLANESILYVQDGAQRLREFFYSHERGGYISPDLTKDAEHIGRKTFVELAWQRSPCSLLWGVRGNGELATLTLDRTYSIQAWQRQPTDGTVESIAVIPGTPENIVYMVVKRGAKKYIEYLKPIDWGDDETDCFLVDSGLTTDHTATTDSIEGATPAEPVVITATGHPFVNDEFVKITGVVGMIELNGNTYMVKNKAENTFELYETDGTTPVDGTGFTAYESGGTCTKVVKVITGLNHLEGKTVAVYADGVELGDEVVSGNQITIDAYASKIHVGLPYTGKLAPQRLGQFLKTRIPEAQLVLYRTRGGKIGADSDNLHAIPYKDSSLFTGLKDARVQGTFTHEGDLLIVQDQPLPMTVLAIVADMSV